MDRPAWTATANVISANGKRLCQQLWLAADAVVPRQNKQAENIFVLNFLFERGVCFLYLGAWRFQDYETIKKKSAENFKFLFYWVNLNIHKHKCVYSKNDVVHKHKNWEQAYQTGIFFYLHQKNTALSIWNNYKK